MKKYLRILAMSLAAVMLMSMTTLAADTEPSIKNVAEGATVAFLTGNKTLSVNNNNASIQSDGQYLILVVKGTSDSYTIQEGTILYIDQVQATAAGTVTFDKVYPSSIQNSVVLISGTGLSGPVRLADIEVPYTLGDIDLDGDVTAADAVAMNQHLAGITPLQGNAELAADIDGDGDITAADAVFLNQYLAGIISSF